MATQKILTKGATGLQEVVTVETSAGAADANKIPNTNAAGVLDPSVINAKATSAGAADAGKLPLLNASGVLDASIVNSTVASAGAGSAARLVALDASGKLDQTILPVGVGTDAISMQASEAISAGDLINIHNVGGPRVRKADASNGRPAHGFAPAAIGSGVSGTVLFEGTNSGVSARTPGAIQFLGTAGAMVETPPAGSGTLWQQVGMASTATSMSFSYTPAITQA